MAAHHDYDYEDNGYENIGFSITNKTTVPISLTSGDLSIKLLRKEKGEMHPVNAEIVNAAEAERAMKA